MDCQEKNRLLHELHAREETYREAIRCCRICKTCTSETPEDRTVCKLDSVVDACENAHAALLAHFDIHQC